MEATTKQFVETNQKFIIVMNKYAIDNDCVNDIFHHAKVFFEDMCKIAHRDNDFMFIFYIWMQRGGSIELKKLLSRTNYNNNLLIDFNAFTLLDIIPKQ